ncbi:MAG: hypothetical protein QF704_06905 [Anaerolineales bacterium]|nr:hypothetical protein [Anaerolineales bacterium]
MSAKTARVRWASASWFARICNICPRIPVISAMAAGPAALDELPDAVVVSAMLAGQAPAAVVVSAAIRA